MSVDEFSRTIEDSWIGRDPFTPEDAQEQLEEAGHTMTLAETKKLIDDGVEAGKIQPISGGVLFRVKEHE